MATNRRYIIANSDPYTDGTVRPPEELEAAVKRVRTVPLTLGHPPKDVKGIPEHQLLGKVELQYDAQGQRQLGKFSFYDEYWKRLPKELQDRVVNHQGLDISPGFGFEWGEDDNVITKIVPAHVAVLTDERPLCPLDKCGVNVRMESGSGQYRYEQRTEATDPDAEKAPEKTELELLREEVAEMKTLFIESQKKSEEPVVVEHEATEQAEAPPQREPEAVRAPDPVPVRETPASAPEPQDEFERCPITGGIILPSRHDRSKEQ